jgi:hypothetical protein
MSIPVTTLPQETPSNLHSREARAALAKMIMSLFDHWNIAKTDQAALLGLSQGSRSTLSRYRNGEPFADNRDLLDRAGHLLGIHKALRILFPHNRDLVYRWVTTTNRRFNGKTPLEVMCDKGFLGLLMVRRYLDFERGR